MGNHYGFGTTLQLPYEEAIPRVEEALKAEGFGVLTEIDVRQILRDKLGAEMEPYLFHLNVCLVNTPRICCRFYRYFVDSGMTVFLPVVRWLMTPDLMVFEKT